MRPDRIVVDEVRGGEALEMLQAMNTGHEGSMFSAHANTRLVHTSRLEAAVRHLGTMAPPEEGPARRLA
jgi:pilus assembly protein CpaF